MAVHLTLSKDFDECEPICLANFPNGEVSRESVKRPKMSLMRKTGERNMNKRVVVGETGNMTYSGTNFETEGGLYTPTYCKYLVGSLDQETGTMTLHKADVYQMTVHVKGMGIVSDDSILGGEQTPTKSRFTKEDYSSTHDKMVQSFGSERAKRAWSAVKRNKFDSSALDSTLTSALSYAEEELQKAEEEDPKQLVQTSSFIPPCNIDAGSPEEVYKQTDIISSDVMALLQPPATTLVRATKEDISRWKQSHSEYVLSHIALLPKGGGAYKTASMLVYAGYLIKMYCMHTKELEKHGLSKLTFIPEPLQLKLMAKFTEQNPNCSHESTGVLTNRMKDKILAHLLVLALMIDGYTLGTTVLQQDLKVQSTKILEVCKALGCSISSSSSSKSIKGDTVISLKTPVSFSGPSQRRTNRKRR